MNILAAHVRGFWRLRQHFENPFLITLLRLGFIKLKYFPHAIRNGRNSYLMLGRPTSTTGADLFVLREVLIDETYRDLLPLLPQRALRLVGIGANLGSFTIWLSQVAKVENAYCFEPDPDSFQLLRFNLANNGCGFAHALDQAVGGQSRTAQITLNESKPGATDIYSTAPGRPEGKSIKVVAFSEWLQQTPGAFDLLKLDCEGAEWEILRKTTHSELARFGAVVAEVHEDPEKLQTVEEFPALMEAAGFRTVPSAPGLYLGVRRQPGAAA